MKVATRFGCHLLGLVLAWTAQAQAATHAEDTVFPKIYAARGTVSKNSDGKVDLILLHARSDDQIEAIDFTVFSRLETVLLLSPKITKRSIIHLRTIPPGLLTLKITDTPLDEKELAALLQKQKSLILLSLRGTSITDKTLSGIGNLPDLNALELSHTKISDDGLKKIANLQELAILDLSHTDVSDVGLREIKKLPNLGGLRLNGTKLHFPRKS